MSVERARELRRSQTKAEARLWSALRNRQLKGLKFRRQVPLGYYIVDFLCEAEQLVVELDGGQHALEEGRVHDAGRTNWIEGEGYRVVRFWNNEVLDNLEGVLSEILRSAHPDHPSPSSG